MRFGSSQMVQNTRTVALAPLDTSRRQTDQPAEHDGNDERHRRPSREVGR